MTSAIAEKCKYNVAQYINMAKTKRKVAGKKNSMFYEPPRHPSLAKIVCISSPSCARKAARTLLQMFKKALKRGDRAWARTIKQAVVLAANRARASAKRRSLSLKERRELKEVARIYEAAADKMVLPPKRR